MEKGCCLASKGEPVMVFACPCPAQDLVTMTPHSMLIQVSSDEKSRSQHFITANHLMTMDSALL